MDDFEYLQPKGHSARHVPVGAIVADHCLQGSSALVAHETLWIGSGGEYLCLSEFITLSTAVPSLCFCMEEVFINYQFTGMPLQGFMVSITDFCLLQVSSGCGHVKTSNRLCSCLR